MKNKQSRNDFGGSRVGKVLKKEIKYKSGYASIYLFLYMYLVYIL